MPFVAVSHEDLEARYRSAMFDSLIFHITEWTEGCIDDEDALRIARNVMEKMHWSKRTMDSEIRKAAYFALIRDGYWSNQLMPTPELTNPYTMVEE